MLIRFLKCCGSGRGCRDSWIFVLLRASFGLRKMSYGSCQFLQRDCHHEETPHLSSPLLFPNQCLTSITHGTEDALGDAHDGVGGLVVTADGLAAAGKLPHVLQEVVQGLADHAGRRADLLQKLTVASGCLAGTDTVFHRAVHQLPSLYQLLLTHRRADGGAHDLGRYGEVCCSGCSWCPGMPSISRGSLGPSLSIHTRDSSHPMG